MKRLLLVAFATALLGGCAGTPAVTTTPTTAATTPTTAPPSPVTSPLASIASLTAADAAASIAEAQAATPPDTEWVSCVTYVQANQAALTGNLTNGPMPVGVLSAAEKARLAVLGLGSTLSPVNKTAFETACGPLLISIQNSGLTLANELTALVGAIAIKGGALAAIP